MKETILHAVCGQPAFLYAGIPVPGERIEFSRCRHLDGSKMRPGERCLCGTCMLPLHSAHLAPGPHTYDMTDNDDMEILYAPYRHNT